MGSREKQGPGQQQPEDCLGGGSIAGILCLDVNPQVLTEISYYRGVHHSPVGAHLVSMAGGGWRPLVMHVGLDIRLLFLISFLFCCAARLGSLSATHPRGSLARQVLTKEAVAPVSRGDVLGLL